MFSKWNENYQRLFGESRFLSQLAIFGMVILSILNFYELIRFINSEFFQPEYTSETSGFNSFWAEERIFIIFQFVILIVFAFRFALSFFNSAKTFWINEFLCLIGFSVLISYWIASRPSKIYYEFFPNELVTFRQTIPLMGSYWLCYLFLSPIRRFIIFIIALTKSK
jgi:hypothetical protein